MIRRKNPRSSGSLELGNHGDIYNQSSFPIRKLTSIKVIKYLILIIVGILVHTAYRTIFQFSDDAVARSRANINIDENLPVDHLNQQLEAEKEKQIKSHIDAVFDEAQGKLEGVDDQHVENPKGAVDNSGNVKVEREVKLEDIKRNQEIFHEDEIEPEAKIEEEKQKKIQETIAEILNIDDIDNNAQKFDPGKVEKDSLKVEQEDVEVVKVDIPDQDSLVKEQEEVVPLEFVEKIKQVEKMEAIPVKLEKHERPPIVLAAMSSTYEQVKQLIASIQDYMPKTKVYVYDLNLEESQRNALKAACHVRLKPVLTKMFPDLVKGLKNYHWRPIIMQMALSEFGHIMWIEPGVRLKSHKFSDLLDTHSKITLIGEKAVYSTNAVTNFRMYKYLPTNRKEIRQSLHLEMKAILMHNENEVQENFMKLYVACALEEKCHAPQGTQDKCDFELTGTVYAQCHHYDESAMNIILKNWFKFDNSKFFISSIPYLEKCTHFYEKEMKLCRNPKDVKHL